MRLGSFALLLAQAHVWARRGRRIDDAAAAEKDWPNRNPTAKEAADSGAKLEAAATMPWLPLHTTRCGGGTRECRPGEGNLAGYRMWGQPYIHREAWVQAKSRRPPHAPTGPHYQALRDTAARIAEDGLVLMAAADFDYRHIVRNWHASARAVGMHYGFVLSMDRELHETLERWRVPSVDNSANLEAWNSTCLQRHIQRVRMERVLALAALVQAGFSVLHTDATTVFLRPVRGLFDAAPLAQADLLVQRDGGPANAARRIGCAVNAGFTLVRSQRADAVLAFLRDVVRRGLVEFYNRWNNVVDQMGWSFLVADTSDLSPSHATGLLVNQSTLTRLGRYGLTLAFLPYHQFPRVAHDWSALRSGGAMIHHLASDGSLGKEYEIAGGAVAPFRGHPQRLDRYDEADFAAFASALHRIGLWSEPSDLTGATLGVPGARAGLLEGDRGARRGEARQLQSQEVHHMVHQEHGHTLQVELERAGGRLGTCLPCCEEPLPGRPCCCKPPECPLPPSCPVASAAA